MPNILLTLPYDTAASLHCTEIVLKYLQALTAYPTTMLIPDIKVANALFHKTFPPLPFEPSIATKLHKRLMDDLLQYLYASTPIYFTTK